MKKFVSSLASAALLSDTSNALAFKILGLMETVGRADSGDRVFEGCGDEYR